MISHINAHLSGSLQGIVPREWMEQNRRTVCSVCGLAVGASIRIHPTCRPLARQAQPTAPATDDQMNDDMPTLDEVCRNRCPTLKRVPRAARHAWGRALTRCMAKGVAENSVSAWTELLMLPKATLLPAPRGGKKRRKASAAYTQDRLARWSNGERSELWNDVRERANRTRTSAGGTPSAKQKAGRAMSLAAAGYDSKACAALLSSGTLPMDAETADKLRALHPTGVPVRHVPADDLPLHGELDVDTVLKELRSFPAGTAGGPSGLRPQHLKDALVQGHSDSFLEQLTDLLSLLASGSAHPAAKPYVAGANLIGIPKKDNGARPIAVGEALRRLTSKSILATSAEHAEEHFWPLQVGVGCKAGIEKAVHTVRAWCEQNSNSGTKVLLKIDFRNAFNSVDRETALREISRHFPGLARWAHWCYEEDSKLFFGDHTVASSCGVQQGDSLGPLAFSAALHPILKEIRGRRDLPLDLLFAYLDDGVLAGEAHIVAAAFELLCRLAQQAGLEVNVKKCELAVPCGSLPPNLENLFPRELLFDEGGNSKVMLRGFELLGVAFGDEDFTTQHMKPRIDEAGRLLQAIGTLDSPQLGLRLMRACTGHCKVSFNARCTPTHLLQKPLKALDDAERDALEDLTGLHVDDDQWLQAGLGLKAAGLGLRSTQRYAAASYAASVALVERDAPAIFQGYASRWEDVTSPAGRARASVAQEIGMQPEELTPQLLRQLKQRGLSRRLDEPAYALIHSRASPDERAILTSECEPGARAFLSVVPDKHAGTWMEPALFIEEVRARLRIAAAAVDSWCPLCDRILDAKGYHPGICAAGGERTTRHNAIREIILEFAHRAGYSGAEREKPDLLLPARPDDTRATSATERGVDNSRRRPADVYVPGWAAGVPAALDFAVTAPHRVEYLPLSTTTPAWSANQYAERKAQHLNTARICEMAGVSFVPMVVETTGAWDVAAGAVLHRMAKHAALRHGTETPDEYQAILARCCVAVRRARAQAAIRRRAANDAAAGN